jgi:hypothetical protein
MDNVSFDMKYCQSNTEKFGCQIGATSSSGGLLLHMKRVTMKGAFANPYEIFGDNTEILLEDCEFSAPTLAGTPCTMFGGLNTGYVVRTRFSGNGGPVVVMGQPDTIDSINCIKRGSNGIISTVVLEDNVYVTPDGQYAMNLQRGRYEVRRGVVVPVNPSQTGNTANGLFTGSTAINQTISVIGVDFGQIGGGGTAINVSQLNTGYGCSGSTVDATCTPPVGQTITPLTLFYPGVYRVAISGPGTVTVPSFTQFELFVVLTQTATVPTARINFPNGPSGGLQRISMTTASTISSVTFSSNVAWTTAGISANSGVTFTWDSASSLWRVTAV